MDFYEGTESVDGSDVQIQTIVGDAFKSQRVTKEARQQTLDEYFEQTGRKVLHKDEFLAWLAPQGDHRHWEIFFGKDESTLAHERRLDLVGTFVSGLRIVARVEIQPVQEVKRAFKIGTASKVDGTFPSMISPMETRKSGGGYVAYDHGNDLIRSSLLDEGARSLEAWLKRYSGAAMAAGLIVDPTEVLARAMSDAAKQLRDTSRN